MTDFRSYFDIPGNITYLNTPGNGLLPRSHKMWRQKRENDFFAPEVSLREEQGSFIEQVKDTIARVFNANAENTFCTPNFSFGFSTLLDGFPKDTRFLLLQEDYPSLNYPVISRGLIYDTVEITARLEQDIEEAIKVLKPQVLLLSLVQYITGIKIDLDFIRNLRAKFPDLIIIGDGTQFLGTEPFDFETSGFDAIGTSGYKWLMAGFGNGFLLINDRLKDHIYQKAQSGSRPKEQMWASKTILHTFFEPGHQDTLAHGTLAQSLLFLEQAGLEKVQQHIKNLTEMAYKEFNLRQWLLPMVAERAIKSPLINIQVDPKIYPTLLEEGIRCFPRGTGIRIGLHVYNTTDDIARLLTVLEKVAK